MASRAGAYTSDSNRPVWLRGGLDSPQDEREADIDFSVDSREQGAWSIVSVAGEVDLYTAPRLRERIIDLVNGGRYQILVDLTSVEFMDSTGLAVLVGGLKRVREHGGSLELVCTKDPVLKLLTITGLDRALTIHSSVAGAIGS